MCLVASGGYSDPIRGLRNIVTRIVSHLRISTTRRKLEVMPSSRSFGPARRLICQGLRDCSRVTRRRPASPEKASQPHIPAPRIDVPPGGELPRVPLQLARRSYATNADGITGKARERARIPRNASPLLCKHPAAYTFEHATLTGSSGSFSPAVTGQLGERPVTKYALLLLAMPGFRCASTS